MMISLLQVRVKYCKYLAMEETMHTSENLKYLVLLLACPRKTFSRSMESTLQLFALDLAVGEPHIGSKSEKRLQCLVK